MYNTFFAPQLTSERRDWSNLSVDKCYIAPDEESQKKATEQERKRQVPEGEKNAVERHAHEGSRQCSRVCEAEGLLFPEEEWEALDTNEKQEDALRRKYRARSLKTEDWNKGRKCFQWRYRQGVCCTAKSFKLGAPKREVKEEDKWTSGWFVEGINDWIKARGDCEKVEWREPR